MTDLQAVFFDFENIAIWADQEFVDLDLTKLMQFLQSRGPVVIKRAYADWGRFSSYRDEMLHNSIDLTQLYSVSASRNKNRADIRMALDALEIAITRPQIHTFVIVSGDSDFGALASRLREYSRYTLGIGPRKISHPLLIKSCDEYVYLETALGLVSHTPETPSSDQQDARQLLQKALAVYGQRGQLPMLATNLKSTMLSLDPSFNEADFGFNQFREWLESHSDLAKLYFKDLQMYVAPAGYPLPSDFELGVVSPASVRTAPTPMTAQSLEDQYQHIIERKLGLIDLQTRRDVLRDIYRELSQRPGEQTTDALLDSLRQRYETQGLVRSKTTLSKIWQAGFRQRAFDYYGQPPTRHVPVRIADDVEDEAEFILRAEASYVVGIIQTGLPVDRAELAAVLLRDRSQVDYIDSILNDLEERGQIEQTGDRIRISGANLIPFRDDPALRAVVSDIEEVQLPEDLPRTPQTATELARGAMLQRSQDFVGAAEKYLQAARIQWDAVASGQSEATLADLHWYVASYASTKAGAVSQVRRNFAAADAYYIAFFALVQEDEPLFERMRGLINPMLSYYWVNTARRLGVTITPASSPTRTAVQLATYPNVSVREAWANATQALAKVNPTLLRRIAGQIRLGQAESVDAQNVAIQIEEMLGTQE